MNLLDRLVSCPLGALAFLSIAASLEVLGDSLFQSGFYWSTGLSRALSLLAGAVTLAIYGALVNVPRWDFGRLIGVYVGLVFLMAQIVNRVRFGHWPTPPIFAGGTLILAGGLVIAFWKG